MAPLMTHTAKPHDAPYEEPQTLIITTLVSIASIIGSGILALPVTMFQTAFPLFLIVFTVSFFAQVLQICAAVDLFQRVSVLDAHAHSLSGDIDTNANPDASPEALKTTYGSSSTAPPQIPSTPGQPLPTSSSSLAASEPPPPVSLYTVAAYFLPTTSLKIVFHIVVLMGFLSLLVSYGLAGPQALWQLFQPPGLFSTPPLHIFLSYSGIGCMAVIFFLDVLLPIFSTLTFVKGTLFVAVVAIVAALPSATFVTTLPSMLKEPVQWGSFATPLLMSTVALGGLANTMPVTYVLLPRTPTKAQVARYRLANIIGVTICYVLNVGWVIATLQVVPRAAPPGEPSLNTAFLKGEISTVVLVEALQSKQSSVQPHLLHAVETIVEMFILISTAVSFFVVAAGCKSYVDGVIAEVSRRMHTSLLLTRAVVYSLTFGTVVTTVLLDPQGFISVLTVVTSFGLNFQSLCLVVPMVWISQRAVRRHRHRRQQLLKEPPSLETGGAKASVPSATATVSNAEAEQSDHGIPFPMSRVLTWLVLIGGGMFFLGACLLVVRDVLVGRVVVAPHE